MKQKKFFVEINQLHNGQFLKKITSQQLESWDAVIIFAHLFTHDWPQMEATNLARWSFYNNNRLFEIQITQNVSDEGGFWLDGKRIPNQ